MLKYLTFTRGYSAYYQRRKVNNNPATNPLIYSVDLSARYTSATVEQNLCEQPTPN